MKTIYQGDRITILPITIEDTDRVVCWRNNPEVLRNFIDQQTLTPEMHALWMEKKVQTGEVFQFIIHDHHTQTDIGSVFIRDIDLQHLHGEYGIFIGENTARGLGLGTEACRLICQFGFEELGLERIFLRVLASNSGAIRSYEKVGFVKEGCFRKHLLLQGHWHDLIYMGLLKEEFNYEK